MFVCCCNTFTRRKKNSHCVIIFLIFIERQVEDQVENDGLEGDEEEEYEVESGEEEEYEEESGEEEESKKCNDSDDDDIEPHYPKDDPLVKDPLNQINDEDTRAGGSMN